MNATIDHNSQGPDYTALFELLSQIPTVKVSGSEGFVTLAGKERTMRLSVQTLAVLASKGLIVHKGQAIYLTDAGKQYVPENAANRRYKLKSVDQELVMVNDEESPLATLVSRKMPDGSPFLQPSEFAAGERIRLDFSCAMLMPRTSANWQASVSGGRRSDRTNGVEDITHSAMAARDRYNDAMQCLGRDLAGVVADICCYLKGFEQVEMERKWPKRSAKFMLKAGLSILALHYNPPAKTHTRSHKWGAADYRPKIS